MYTRPSPSGLASGGAGPTRVGKQSWHLRVQTTGITWKNFFLRTPKQQHMASSGSRHNPSSSSGVQMFQTAAEDSSSTGRTFFNHHPISKNLCGGNDLITKEQYMNYVVGHGSAQSGYTGMETTLANEINFDMDHAWDAGSSHWPVTCSPACYRCATTALDSIASMVHLLYIPPKPQGVGI